MNYSESIREGQELSVEVTSGIWVVIEDKRKQILSVVENNPEQNIWKKKWQEWLIFGKKEQQEMAIEAAIREVQEEAGLCIGYGDLKLEWDLEFIYNKRKKIQLAIFRAFVDDFSDIEQISDEEIGAINVTSYKEILEKWQKNNSLIRPLTLESIYIALRRNWEKFRCETLRGWEYDERYIFELEKISQKIYNLLKEKWY